MKLYLLKESLQPCAEEEFTFPEARTEAGRYPQYVAVLTPEEWAKKSHLFGMTTEQDLSMGSVRSTKAEVGFDSLTGSFLIPDRSALCEKRWRFSFALDGNGIAFIDDSGKADEMTDEIARSKHAKRPCLERFLYDFLELIIAEDLSLMQDIEKELDDFESRVLSGEEKLSLERINEMRSRMRELRIHYAQLIDMTQELEENENGFFKEKDLNYLHLFMNRMLRLDDIAASDADHRLVRHELPLHARARKALGLPRGDTREPCDRGGLPDIL